MLAKTLRLRPDKGDNAFQAFTRLACLLRPQVGTRLLESFAKLIAQRAGLVALVPGTLPQGALDPQLLLEHVHLAGRIKPSARLVERTEQQQVDRPARDAEHDERHVHGGRQPVTRRARQGKRDQADLAYGEQHAQQLLHKPRIAELGYEVEGDDQQIRRQHAQNGEFQRGHAAPAPIAR